MSDVSSVCFTSNSAPPLGGLANGGVEVKLVWLAFTHFETGVVMKNPFMSMFLSQANRVANQVAGSARAQATAAVKREASKNMAEMTRVWTDAMFPLAKPTRRKKRAGPK